jgi:predicted AlkP superfamily phosphohydrolase/phosphomutase
MKDMFRQSRFQALRKLYDAAARVKHSLFDRSGGKKYKSWGELANEEIPQQKSPIDWARTRVAAVEGSETAHLFVNVAGRGTQGIVQPGIEYENLVSELIAHFQEIRHPRTGEKLLARVARGREIYPETQEGILIPDVILIPVDGYGFSLSVSDAPPAVSNEGSHRHNGVLLMQGEGLRRSVEDFRPNLIDVTPTILHLLGLAIPSDMDGRVLQELFTEVQPVRTEEADNRQAAETKTEYSKQEAELIEQRLKGLGYIE